MTATELPAPRFNHVAMSVPSDLLDEEHRDLLTKFYRDVFGFEEHAMLTADRKRLVLGALRPDQFLYIIANDDPMTCPRLDHWGMSVESEEQLDLYLDRAKKFREEDPASTSSTSTSRTTARSRSSRSTSRTCCR